MAQGSFTAGVNAWVAETKQRMGAVRKESAQRVVEIMQTPVAKGGRMRVDTGFLRASLVGMIGQGSFAPREKPEGVAHFTYDAGAINLVIAGAKPSDAITVGYTAIYARPREYGARGQPGDAFVRLAAQQWGRVVSDVCVELRGRAK